MEHKTALVGEQEPEERIVLHEQLQSVTNTDEKSPASEHNGSVTTEGVDIESALQRL